jgi:fructan beta-fructosidase
MEPPNMETHVRPRTTTLVAFLLLAAFGSRLRADDYAKEELRRQIVIRHRYLLIPVKTGAPMRRMTLSVEGKIIREFDVELSDHPDFQAFYDVSPFANKPLEIRANLPATEQHHLDAITQSDVVSNPKRLYDEQSRPQFHFTSKCGWLNDPNGLVYSGGEYHLFYQHNPYGWNWGNMHWGHAVSPDLIHWTELPIAISPKSYGDWVFSGSAVVDTANTAGFQRGTEPSLVAAFTSTGRGECLAYSNDRGRTWTEFTNNPAVKHAGRDPRLLWHAPTKRWVMAVYDEQIGKRAIAFYTSPNLKFWQFASRIEGFFECPDLFELAIGHSNETKWILASGDAKYLVGKFNGRTFRPDSPVKQQVRYGNFYAAQTFSGTPDGRRIQIGWASGIAFPGMPFNQQMTVPCQLTLRNTPDGPRLFAEPVDELKSLREMSKALTETQITPQTPLRSDIRGELLDVELELQGTPTSTASLTVRGIPVVFDFRKNELSCRNVVAPLEPVGERIRLRVLVDRGSIEIFGNDGRVTISVGATPRSDDQTVELSTKGGDLIVYSLNVAQLRSAWAAQAGQ